MFNIRMPEPPDFSEKSNCEHLGFCSKLDVVTADCRAGASPVYRCRQGDFAQIQLLSRILQELAKSHSVDNSRQRPESTD